MTFSAQKKEQLTEFLGSLPNAAALKLFKGLEAERLVGPANGKTNLPHDMLLGELRAQLLARGAALPGRRKDANGFSSLRLKTFLSAPMVRKSVVHGLPGVRLSQSGGS